MHPRYAAVFGIENLTLNKYFQPASNAPDNNTLTQNHTSSTTLNSPSKNTLLEPIALCEQLLADIKRAAVPIAINSVVQGTKMQLDDDQLILTTPQLSIADKRALWALISEHLDKF